MRLQIDFFKDDFNKAVTSGFYGVDIYMNGKIKNLCKRESKHVLVTCSESLWLLKNNYPSCLDITQEIIENSEATLIFYLLEQNDESKAMVSDNFSISKHFDVQVNFFENNFVEAISYGIYEINVHNMWGETATLYIGESETVLKRCSEHLFKLSENSEYLGFTEDIFENFKIKLTFHLLEQISDMSERRKRQNKLIKEKKTLSQSGRSDHLKEVKERTKALKNFLKQKPKNTRNDLNKFVE